MCHRGQRSMRGTPGGQKPLKIRLLGELAVVRGGEARGLPASKKARALLGYLVATGRPHLRERLCELLWDGPDDPRASLRWALAKLRPVVSEHGYERLVTDRDHGEFAASTTEALQSAAARFAGRTGVPRWSKPRRRRGTPVGRRPLRGPVPR